MIYSEKIPLLPTSQSFSIRPRHFTLIALCAISIVAWFSYSARLPSFSTVPTTSLCPIQPPPLSSTPDWVLDSNFRLLALDRLKGAVRIPTQSYDDMGDPAEDGRFEPMKVLGNYINETFPLLHAALELELVSKFGRLYTWKGSNTALKPIVLMAHQDGSSPTISLGRAYLSIDVGVMLVTHIAVEPQLYPLIKLQRINGATRHFRPQRMRMVGYGDEVFATVKTLSLEL